MTERERFSILSAVLQHVSCLESIRHTEVGKTALCAAAAGPWLEGTRHGVQQCSDYSCKRHFGLSINTTH
jgi:hypothetical protein